MVAVGAVTELLPDTRVTAARRLRVAPGEDPRPPAGGRRGSSMRAFRPEGGRSYGAGMRSPLASTAPPVRLTRFSLRPRGGRRCLPPHRLDRDRRGRPRRRPRRRRRRPGRRRRRPEQRLHRRGLRQLPADDRADRRAHVRAAGAGVPVAAPAGGGGAAERAQRRRGLGRGHARLAEGARLGRAVGDPRRRLDPLLATADGLRVPVRPLDGLRGVHPRPHARGLRRDRLDRGRRRRGHRPHGAGSSPAPR